MNAIRLLVLLVLWPVPALAGTIFGNLREEAKSVGAGVTVQITCGGNPYQVATDDYGAYSINVPPGRCDLTVQYKGAWTAAYPVASSDDPARYDFDLVYENEKYVLRRR